MTKDNLANTLGQTAACNKCQKPKPKCPNGPVAGVEVQVPAVVARATTQILAEAVVPFPSQFPAKEIVQVIKRVKDLIITICADKVLINGVLDVNVVYKTLEGNYSYRHGGYDPEATFGDVKQIGFDIPFAGFTDAPGAEPGDDYIVNFAGVENECQIEILEDKIVCPGRPDTFRKVRVKAIVLVDLSVIRNILVPIRDLENITPISET